MGTATKGGYAIERTTVDEIRVGDAVLGQSIREAIRLGVSGHADVVEAYSDAADPTMVYLTLQTAWSPLRRRVRVRGADTVVRLVPIPSRPDVPPDVRERCQARYDAADGDERKIANLHAIEVLSLKWRLSRGKPSPVVVPVGFAPGDPHPFDVVIDDVETTAVDAIADLIVYLRDHGYDASALVARAVDTAAAELAGRRTGARV